MIRVHIAAGDRGRWREGAMWRWRQRSELSCRSQGLRAATRSWHRPGVGVPPRDFRDSTALPKPSFWTSGLHNHDKKSFYCFKLPSLRSLAAAAQEMNTRTSSSVCPRERGMPPRGDDSSPKFSRIERRRHTPSKETCVQNH